MDYPSPMVALALQRRSYARPASVDNLFTFPHTNHPENPVILREQLPALLKRLGDHAHDIPHPRFFVAFVPKVGHRDRSSSSTSASKANLAKGVTVFPRLLKVQRERKLRKMFESSCGRTQVTCEYALYASGVDVSARSLSRAMTSLGKQSRLHLCISTVCESKRRARTQASLVLV
ncbi:hypothetical protein JVT61DRAFT_9793 [Boletus reticuloceps]|uniref:Uncharacterized protein n=1 Tax=Boletus reticuloceps TaxID=495285 RepID=A0A8I2YG46_9AGAM|nr:hypothetical protein JVT61DRAFT_9793 [Boletus reticuloceps]